LNTLNNKPDIEAIDVDLMTDYVKVIYADLLEWRERLVFSQRIAATPPEKPSAPITTALSPEEPEKEDGADLDPTPLPEEIVQEMEQTMPGISLNLFDKEEPQKAPEKLASIDTQPIPFPQKKEDVRKFIGINEKFVFINELFDGNRDAYEEVLTELIEFSNTEDAIDWLTKTVAKPYDWKEDDFNVQDFYRVLESYYRRRKN